MPNLVTVDELSKPMTESDYTAFLGRMRNKRYINHADMGDDGEPLDDWHYISAGADILLSLTAEE